MHDNINLISTLRIIRDKHLIDLVNNKNSNKKALLVYLINDESDINKNKEKKDYFEDLRSKKLNYRLNQKRLYTVSNTRYYNFSYYF